MKFLMNHGLKLGLIYFHSIIIVVDYTSKIFEIPCLPNTEPSPVINHTKAQFSSYATPRDVVSDNGPQFNYYRCKIF